MRYIGTCPKHGMVSHEVKKDLFIIRGAHCPFCLSALDNAVISEKPRGRRKSSIFGL
jgi:hypothetical protein